MLGRHESPTLRAAVGGKGGKGVRHMRLILASAGVAAVALFAAFAGSSMLAAGARADSSGPGSTSARKPPDGCPKGEIRVRRGCVGTGAARRRVVALARRGLKEHGLRAVILRVDVGRRRLVSAALGESMAGVPAVRRMHFRIGSMAIPYLTNLLLQLQDKGRLSLDDKLSRWLPDLNLPNADQVTLKMLANNTSGYPDWIQGNEVFVEDLFDNVFRQWRPNELLAYAFDRPLACEPGACFNYAHTNYAILSKVLRAVTGKPVRRLMRKRIFRPLGLRSTKISRHPRIPRPVLHAYSSDRGPYEDSTYWSPSWTIGSGTIMTSTIRDVARSAQAVGRGRLLSRRARRAQFAPSTVGLPGMTRELYYGLGILIAGGWRLQNPLLNGYSGVMAYLPSRKISIAVTATNGESASRDGRSYSEVLAEEIGGYLAPRHPISLPGASGPGP